MKIQEIISPRDELSQEAVEIAHLWFAGEGKLVTPRMGWRMNVLQAFEYLAGIVGNTAMKGRPLYRFQVGSPKMINLILKDKKLPVRNNPPFYSFTGGDVRKIGTDIHPGLRPGQSAVICETRNPNIILAYRDLVIGARQNKTIDLIIHRIADWGHQDEVFVRGPVELSRVTVFNYPR